MCKAARKGRQAKAFRMRTFSQGFTYLGILLTIALIATSLSAAGASWSIEKRRAEEKQLLYIGQAYRRAIASYYNKTPHGAHQYPTRLEDLLHDERGTKISRHIREIYPDPLTKKADWNLITLPNESIIGVASRATNRPLKRSNFDGWEAAFENADCYCDWRFVYLPQLLGD